MVTIMRTTVNPCEATRHHIQAGPHGATAPLATHSKGHMDMRRKGFWESRFVKGILKSLANVWQHG